MTNEQLCILARQGKTDAQNLLIENNLRFIKKTAYEVWSAQAERNQSLKFRLMILCRRARWDYPAVLQVITQTVEIYF